MRKEKAQAGEFENSHAAKPWHAPPTWMLLIFFLVLVLIITFAYMCWNVYHARQVAELEMKQRKAQREEERIERAEFEQRHNQKLQKPVEQLLGSVKDVMKTHSGFWSSNRQDPEAVISKLDNEKITIHTGAWKFKCKASGLEASVRAKLDQPGNSHLPKSVVESIVSSLQYDEEVATHQRNFDVDGMEGKGHFYQFRLQSTQSNGVASVALMAFGTDFDMKKVVDHYETHEEPVYEFVPAPKNTQRKCTTRTTHGPLCVFPFQYAGHRFQKCSAQFSSALWCATSTYGNDQMYHWGWCQAETCTEEEEPGPRYIKKFVRMAEKKFPVYSKRALPPDVSQSDLALALDWVASKEAEKILSA
eukprot:TRINITY_DN90098_c0_g1_i1.p1 TRINITY_DN90098_c0_g1~~TRINITY_DN90098_c0_g1_i1.p1  ORF type:complete len:361 (-),score=67.43 TRINITY_DN90098_c0_g1_i1:380-1462(-)